MNEINDSLDQLEKIVLLFSEEWGNEPSVITIYDSNLLLILTRLHALLSVKYTDVDVKQDIRTFLEFEELSTRFRKIEEDLSFAITETYREVQIQSLGDAYDKLVDIAIDYPSEKPVVTPQELHERIWQIKFLTEDTYRILHFYVTHALIEIRDMLYLNDDQQRRTEMIRKGFRDYLNEIKTEFGFELCYSPLCERIAGFFRSSLTEKVAPVHWEQLYRLDKLTIDFAIKRDSTRKDFKPEYIKAVRELLASIKKLDTEIEDICKRHIQSRFVKDLFENKMLAHLLSGRLNKEKRLIDMDYFNLNTISRYLNSENIDWFYEAIHRHNVIQCGMFPELRPKYELWFVGVDNTHADNILPKLHEEESVKGSGVPVSHQNALVNYKEKIRSLLFEENPILDYKEMSQFTLLFLSLVGKKVIAKGCETTKFVEYVAEIVPELYEVEKNSKNKNQKPGKRTKEDYAKSINKKLQDMHSRIENIAGQGDVKNLVREIYKSRPNKATDMARKIDSIFEKLK